MVPTLGPAEGRGFMEAVVGAGDAQECPRPTSFPHMAWVSLAAPRFQVTSGVLDGDGLAPARAGGRGARTHIDGAAEEGAFLQSLLDDPEQVGRGLPELIPLRDAPREVLEALGGGAPRERFITAVDPEGGQMLLLLLLLEAPPQPPTPLPPLLGALGTLR